MLFLFIAFIVIPLIEISVIGEVQEALGWPTTIVILVLDSMVGAYLVRLQGSKAWRAFQQALGRAQMPTEEIIDGALILFGGALLLTPGFVTDAVGLAAVITPTRKLLNAGLRRRLNPGRWAAGGGSGPFGNVFVIGGRPPGGPAGPGPGAGAGPRGDARRGRIGFVPDDEDEAADRSASRDGRTRPRREPGVIDVEVVEVRRNDDDR